MTEITQQGWLKTLTGTRIRIAIPGCDTENRLTVIDYIEQPNTTPPVFTRHEFIEVFCVTGGVLTFQFLEEDRFTISAGESVTCPSWKPHSFWNETDQPATVQLICSPAGLDEFFIASDLLLQLLARDEVSETALKEQMTALRDRFGLEHVGKPPKSITE